MVKHGTINSLIAQVNRSRAPILERSFARWAANGINSLVVCRRLQTSRLNLCLEIPTSVMWMCACARNVKDQLMLNAMTWRRRKRNEKMLCNWTAHSRERRYVWGKFVCNVKSVTNTATRGYIFHFHIHMAESFRRRESGEEFFYFGQAFANQKKIFLLARGQQVQ